jgi:hypothetical protein
VPSSSGYGTPLKYQEVLTQQHSITSQKNSTCNNTAVVTSNLSFPGMYIFHLLSTLAIEITVVTKFVFDKRVSGMQFF